MPSSRDQRSGFVACAALAICLVTAHASVAAQPSTAPAAQPAEVSALQARVDALEKRLAEIEKRIAGDDRARQQQTTLRQRFNQRMDRDFKKYTQEQMREAEELYQQANKNWESPASKAALKQMIDKYPDVNRTGCAVLYLGQMSAGEAKVKYLQQAIDKHADCMYGDGVQVGAYARYLLAGYYKQHGAEGKMEEMLAEIEQQYPDAVDHGGRKLKDLIAQVRAQPPK